MVGVNAGGQLNILVLEVGWITRDPLTGIELVTTVGVHPLVVAPRSIVYTDTSRSTSTRTLGGSHTTVGGRDLRTVQLDGSFGGPEVKGLTGYLGTGAVLFRRFYDEVVRLGDALSREDVNAAVNVLTSTPGLSAVSALFDPERCVPFINFYDFWRDRAFSCTIPSWRDTVAHTGGGATGVFGYSMTIKEAGPLVEGGLGEAVLSALLSGLTFFDALSNVVETYTVSNVVDSFIAGGTVIGSELADLVAAVGDQVRDMQAILSGHPPSSNTDMSSALASFSRLAKAAEDLADLLNATRSATPTPRGGEVDWAGAPGEGTQLDVEAFDEGARALDLADRLGSLSRGGVYFGMSDDAFEDLVTSGGESRAAPDIASSLTHTIGAYDTLGDLEARYGVTAERILDVNGLLPDEALIEGTVLAIPVLRRAGAQSAIVGLPTFGSHIGLAALGTDLDASFQAGPDGDLLLVSGTACVEQGVAILVEELAETLLRAVNSVPPPARAAYLAARYRAALISDRRIRSVVAVDVAEGDADYTVNVVAELINGQTARFGG